MDDNPFRLHRYPGRPEDAAIQYHSGLVYAMTQAIASGALMRWLQDTGYDFAETVSDTECNEFERLCHIRYAQCKGTKTARAVAFEADKWYRTLPRNRAGRRLCITCGCKPVEAHPPLKLEGELNVTRKPRLGIRCKTCEREIYSRKKCKQKKNPA